MHVLSAYNAFKRITSTDNDTPLVFWHGMGDSYNSNSMQRALEVVNEVNPNVDVFSVFVDVDDSKDQKASLFGDVNDQIDFVCDQLNSIDELSNGFNFIGFSQGGLFARSAIERCHLNVKKLITFGSPHSGISDLPKCSSWFCEKRNQLLKKQIWKQSIQTSVIPAQYFRDPLDYDNYLNYSNFLADINNEINLNQTYIDNLSNLEKLVLIRFEKDQTLVPLNSAWFYDQNEDGEIQFNETMFYEKDLVGLKNLYDEDKIEFLSIDGDHMEVTDEYLKFILETYLS